MAIEFTKLSSKGQVVIPQDIRDRLKLQEGEAFLVVTQDDTICLKKMEIPEPKTWKDAVKPFRDAAKKSGFTKKDLDRLIVESRKK